MCKLCTGKNNHRRIGYAERLPVAGDGGQKMRHFFQWLLALAAALSFSLPATSAPQILLSVGSEETIPMRCDGHLCEAEIATICLQTDRSDPARGTPYALLDPKTLKIVAEGRGGQTVQVPLARGHRIVAARGHTAVRLTIPRALLQRRGLARPALRLKGNAIFAPEPMDGDNDPQSDADIALARTTLRMIAAKVIHHQADRSQAAGVILGAINSLPRNRPPTPAERATAETQLLSAAMPENVSKMVKEAVDHCKSLGTTFIKREPLFSYRGCLTVNHDTMLEELYMDYRLILKSAPWG